MLLNIIFLLGGSALTLFGFFLVFSPKFLEKTRKEMQWKNDPYIGKDSYLYDKYGRGLKLLCVGLLLLGVAIYLLVK